MLTQPFRHLQHQTLYLQETREVFERLKRMENFETQYFDQTVSNLNNT